MRRIAPHTHPVARDRIPSPEGVRQVSFFSSKVRKPGTVFSTFRPSLESLTDRIAPHAGVWTSFAHELGQFGVLSNENSANNRIATHFAIRAESTAYEGGEIRMQVVALDERNRPVKNFTGTVTFSSTDGAAGLPEDYAFTADDRGKHVFTATLSTLGMQTITVTDTENAELTGDAKIHVLEAPVATQFRVRIETPAYAGAETRVVVMALDDNNRPVPTYTGTVALTSSDPDAVLPENYTFTADDRGRHVFTITPSAVGELTVTATDTENAELTGEATVTVAEAPAVENLVVLARPVARTGATVTVFVVALDETGRVATNYSGTIQFSSSDDAAVLPDDYTFTADDHGVKTFTVTLESRGRQTITATDTETGELVGTMTINVLNPPALSHFGDTFGEFPGAKNKVKGWSR
jgi:hypothetical protein